MFPVMLKAPKFWFKEKDAINIPSLILAPISKCWEIVIKRRLLKGDWEIMPVPIICVGNLLIGGAGKTPVTQAIQTLLSGMGFKAHVVSRGYGGKLKGPAYVSEISSFSDVGDEPILLSKTGPVLIAKDRKMGIYKAFENGANVILLDDGFQNSSTAKDLSLVVVDSRILFGNQRIIPSGPLREPIHSGLNRADAIVLIDQMGSNESKLPNFNFPSNIPIIKAKIKSNQDIRTWSNGKFIAFSGIAHPKKFLNSLNFLGFEIVKSYNFSDHYNYKKKDIEKLQNVARSLRAKLVTTEKDFVRIPISLQENIHFLPIHVEFEKPEMLKNMLRNTLSR